MTVDGATASGATATRPAAADPLIGRLIADRFRIVSLIARGGMGKVYKAEQAPLGRICALKVLNPNYNGDADPEFHRRFYREASITSRITHPNSVTIFDYGKTDDEVYYMAMEYLEGQTLHQALRDAGTMTEDRVGRISQQICRALREAHTLDVIHRDLKPANIFLSRHGDDEDFVKVLDFGLVKHLSERPEEQLTQTGLFMGSPKYMAPEQIQGGQVDARTDVYSLGIMMYELLAGKVPFERATSVNILMAHVGEPPPPLRAVNPNLVCSPSFEDLVMRCIAKDPNDRYPNMNAVLNGIKLAHGGSLTGQLAAVSASGNYNPLQSQPPPAVRSSAPGFAPAQTPNGTSGSHTPLGTLQALNASSLTSSGSGPGLYGLDYGLDAYPDRARRSWRWVAVGVLVAAVMGGLLGMAAFRMTTSSPIELTRSSPATPTAGVAGATGAGKAGQGAAGGAASVGTTGTTSATPNAGSGDARSVTLHVTSEPAGSNVREDAAELCAATPCDVTFRGDAADPSKVHRLVLTHIGFRAEARNVKPGDPPLQVKLFREARGVRASTPPAGTAAASATAKPADPTPNGFKDLPY